MIDSRFQMAVDEVRGPFLSIFFPSHWALSAILGTGSKGLLRTDR
jgi:hypothetical protein